MNDQNLALFLAWFNLHASAVLLGYQARVCIQLKSLKPIKDDLTLINLGILSFHWVQLQ